MKKHKVSVICIGIFLFLLLVGVYEKNNKTAKQPLSNVHDQAKMIRIGSQL